MFFNKMEEAYNVEESVRGMEFSASIQRYGRRRGGTRWVGSVKNIFVRVLWVHLELPMQFLLTTKIMEGRNIREYQPASDRGTTKDDSKAGGGGGSGTRDISR